MSLPSRVLLAIAVLALAACAPPAIIKPYRIDIQQGNYVSQDMVAQLRPGMTKEQVRYLLGTPLITDIFHADRWDYVYYYDKAYSKPEERKINPQSDQIYVVDENKQIKKATVKMEGKILKSTLLIRFKPDGETVMSHEYKQF